ncbi:MAG: tetratricopeptide repeat protein, partial [Planctomycetota bacterium]
MKPRPGSLAILALLAAVARAQTEREVIRDQDLAPYRLKFLERLGRVQSKDITLEQLVETYGREAAAKAERREAAIRAYIHGTLLMRINRMNDARAELERALGLWPEFPAAHLDLARLAAQIGDMREAKRHVKKALEYDPMYAKAMTLQGDFARFEKDLETAKRWYERSLDRRPTVDACLGLALVYVGLFQGSYDEEQKKEYALGAINCAETMVLLEADKPLPQRDPVVHLQRA